MSTKDEALKLALEALELSNANHWWGSSSIEKAIAAIREALAEQPAIKQDLIPEQPAQELLAWKNAAIRVGEELSSVGPNGYYNMTADQWLAWAMDQQPRGKNSLAEQPAQQEPVAWRFRSGSFWNREVHWRYLDSLEGTEGLLGLQPLYTRPPAREWVGLTEQEANELWESTDSDWELMKRTEAKLREKNA